MFLFYHCETNYHNILHTHVFTLATVGYHVLLREKIDFKIIKPNVDKLSYILDV